MHNLFTYIRHKSHKCGLYSHIRDFHEGERSFPDTWFYKLEANISSPTTVFLDQRNLPKRDNLILVENRRTQTV